MISLGYDVTVNYVMCAVQLLYFEVANFREEWVSVCGRMGRIRKQYEILVGKLL